MQQAPEAPEAPTGGRRPGRWIVFVAIVALALGVVGCSDDGDDESSTGQEASSDAQADGNGGGSSAEGGCALVSEDEVAEATGAEVSGSMELPTGCQWEVSGGEAGAYYEWQDVTGAFEGNRAAGGGMEVEEIAGLGDDAYLRTMTNANGEVLAGETWVQVGDVEFFVRTGLVEWSDEVEAGEKALAELLVERVG
jgi:hypothetical protein